MEFYNVPMVAMRNNAMNAELHFHVRSMLDIGYAFEVKFYATTKRYVQLKSTNRYYFVKILAFRPNTVAKIRISVYRVVGCAMAINNVR